METLETLKKSVTNCNKLDLLLSYDSDVRLCAKYSTSAYHIKAMEIKFNEILRRMNTSTKLVADIMSTVACAIDENNVKAACEHLRHLLSLENTSLDTDALVEHLRNIVSLSNTQQQ